MYLSYQQVSYFLMPWYTLEYPFVSSWRIPFSISCKAVLIVTDPFSVCLFGKVFIFPSFLKDNFARYIILGWHFLHFEYIIPLPCDLQGFLLKKNLLIVLCELHMTSCFSLASFKISLFLLLDNLIILCLSVDFFWLLFFGVFWAPSILRFIYCPDLGSFQSLFILISWSIPFLLRFPQYIY